MMAQKAEITHMDEKNGQFIIHSQAISFPHVDMLEAVGNISRERQW